MANEFIIQGLDEWQKDMESLSSKDIPAAAKAATLDLGIDLENNLKNRGSLPVTPIDYGRLIASFGHWEPALVVKEAGLTGAHGPEHLSRDADAYPGLSGDKWVQRIKNGYYIEVGTNVEYAPYVEWGDEMGAQYPGFHMMDISLQQTGMKFDGIVIKHLRAIGVEVG